MQKLLLPLLLIGAAGIAFYLLLSQRRASAPSRPAADPLASLCAKAAVAATGDTTMEAAAPLCVVAVDALEAMASGLPIAIKGTGNMLVDLATGGSDGGGTGLMDWAKAQLP